MESKYLEWINSGKDLESDKELLEEFARWVDRFHSARSVERTVQEGWESIREESRARKPKLH